MRAHSSSDVAVIIMSGEAESKGDFFSSGPGGSSGGEGGSTASLVEPEDNKDAYGNTYKLPSGKDFVHRFSPMKKVGEETVAYKHSLQLQNKDEEIIKYAKDNFKTVIVLLQNDIPTEIGSLKIDPGIDAILLAGRLGNYGHEQIGYVLNGSVNPSGRTVDLWAWDHSGRPSWFNDGNTNNIFRNATQESESDVSNMGITSAFRVGEGSIYYERSEAYSKADDETYPYYKRRPHATGEITPHVFTVQYEEDIYTGYRYYETAATEVALGNYAAAGYGTDGEAFYYDSVIYPFGYGLSYTSFEWEVVSSDLSEWARVLASENSSINFQTGEITVKVKVTNVGLVPGKDVVEIYGHAPYYKNGVSKAEHVLVGFEKTGIIQPGKSQVVTVSVNVQDLASYDYLDANGNGNTGYELDKVADADSKGNPLHDSTGKYQLRLMKNSHEYGNDDAAEMTIDLASPSRDYFLKLDDFTGNSVDNLFSGKDINNTLG